MTHQDSPPQPLPICVTEYIDQVIRRMRYSRSARQEVRQELTDHFTDALADRPDPQDRQKLAEELVAEFGDTKMLAALLRRAKKRNRPPLVKALIRSGQAFLILIGAIILYMAWFLTGRPTVTTNYVAVLSERIQPKAAESENAWPFYRQAVLKFVEPLPVGNPKPDEQPWRASPLLDMDIDLARTPDFLQAALREWMKENDAAWQDYVAATRRPYCWYSISKMRELHYEEAKLDAARKGQPAPPEPQPEDGVWQDSVLMSLLPPLSRVRSLAKMTIWKARLAAGEGDSRQALEHVLAVARSARHWQSPDRYIIEQLVGVAISSLADEELRRLASQGRLAAADFRSAQELLAGLYPAGFPGLGVEVERISLVDTVQRAFTDGGPGGGHPIPRQLSIMMRVSGAGGQSPSGISRLLAESFLLHAGRDKTLAMGKAYYDQVAEWSALTPYQQRDMPDPDAMLRQWRLHDKVRYQLLYILVPSLGRASGLIWRAQAEYEATLAVLALQRYRLDKGQYAPNLETLVRAGYLRQVPADPYSDGPLVYRSIGDAFTLYSVGGDLHDDGGVQNPSDPWNGWQAKPATSSQSAGQPAPATQPAVGDRVFWPVAPLKPYPVDPDQQ